MDQSSQSDSRYLLESQIRECFGRCAYSHKTHEQMAERYDKYQYRFKWGNIVLSGLITGGAVNAVFDQQSPLGEYDTYAIYLTAALAVVSLIFNSCIKEIDYGALAQRHRDTASNIWNIRESYLSLLTDIRDQSTSIDTIRIGRDALQKKLHEIYSKAPFTDGNAYEKAQNRLKNKEDLTFSERELDLMLPTALRRVH